MSDKRRLILSWTEQGHIAESDLPRALAVAEVLPSRDTWRRFFDRLLLWMGTLLVTSGLIFFFAYNWKDLGRFAKFSLVEALMVVALLCVWRFGLDRSEGKAALFGGCLLLGALLALIGQTYQSGADTFELFGTWAAMILPWVLVGHMSTLWLLWLALVNLTLVLYVQVFPTVFGFLFTPDRVLWALFVFNTAALIVWEAVAAYGITWLRRRWEPRLIATASGSFATVLVMLQILNTEDASAWAFPVWLVWLMAALVVYRRPIKDVFVLAGGVLSVIVVVATFLTKHLASDDALGFLMIGLIVITLSVVGSWWLRSVAAEEEQ